MGLPCLGQLIRANFGISSPHCLSWRNPNFFPGTRICLGRPQPLHCIQVCILLSKLLVQTLIIATIWTWIYRFDTTKYANCLSFFAAFFSCNLTALQTDNSEGSLFSKDRIKAFLAQNMVSLIIVPNLIGLWCKVNQNYDYTYDSGLPSNEIFNVCVWTSVTALVLSVLFTLRWTNTIGLFKVANPFKEKCNTWKKVACFALCHNFEFFYRWPNPKDVQIDCQIRNTPVLMYRSGSCLQYGQLSRIWDL